MEQNPTDNQAANESPSPSPELPPPDALETLMASAGTDVDAEKLAKARAILAQFKKTNVTTESGSEAVAEDVAKFSGKGSDVDWSEYDLHPDLRHLYPQAEYRETDQGPKWVYMADEFYSTEREWRSYETTVASRIRAGSENLNLGKFLNDMLNGPDGWRLVLSLPGTTGRVGVLLQRKFPFLLPDPLPLKKSTEVEAPSDPELERLDATVEDFMANMDLTPETEVEDTVSDPLPEERKMSLEHMALALNPPTVRDPGGIAGKIPGDENSLAAMTKPIGEAAEKLLNTEE